MRSIKPQEIQWFGAEPFAIACAADNRCEPPIEKACAWCDEDIAPSDNGFVCLNITLEGEPAPIPWHAECFIRSLCGSVEHQLRQCSCFSATDKQIDCSETDGLTVREEARLAAKIWRDR